MARGTLRFLLACSAAAVVVAPARGRFWVSRARSAEGATVVVNEVQYDPESPTPEGGYEWVELRNVGSATVSLAGWRIRDNASSDEVPALDLPAGEFVVIAGSDAFRELFPDFDGRLVSLNGSIGNGLGNSGDRVLLLDPDGNVVDGMSYGNDAGALDPPAASVAPGHSLERVPAGTDTDTAKDWVDQDRPSPGRPAADRATDVPTAVPPPTAPGELGAVLNEYLPAPRDADWDGDGTASAEDEWVEIYNAGTGSLNIRGWQLDDLADGGSSPFVFPDGTLVEAGGHLVVFRRQSGVALNNDGDSVRLLMPDGTVADQTSFTKSAPDRSYARDGDGSGPWTDALPPSPGRPNREGGSEATAPPPSPTAGGPAQTPAGTPSPGYGTATATGQPGETPDAFLPYLISEVLYDPLEPGTDAAAEWVELHNVSDHTASLAGWAIGDAAEWDSLPPAFVPPLGYVVVAASDAVSRSLASSGASAVVVADGTIGNGLGNRGDLVRLRGPTGQDSDAVSYGSSLAAFDPSVPLAQSGWSIERIPPDQDTDSAEDWWLQPAPSPGRAGERHSGPPVVRLNEVLAAPRDLDWDGSGTADYTDEWVELYNASAYPVDLGGWRLQNDCLGHGWWFELAPGTRVAEGGFYVLYRAATGLALCNDADTVQLQRPDGVLADSFSWSHSAGYDRSWSRTMDGTGSWTDGYLVTPGGPNKPAPSSAEAPGPAKVQAARQVQVRDARLLARRTRVQVRGRVTAPPGVFGPREAYVQDETGGLLVFLGDADGTFGSCLEGAWAIATGRLEDYHGERELVLDGAADFWVDDAAGIQPLAPRDVTTGDVGEAVEGQLVRLGGRVVEVSSSAVTLDDGSGPARAVVRAVSGLRRPRAAIGSRLVVVGIAGQYAGSAPWTGGYRVVPRFAADLGAEPRPELLPRTGLGGARAPSPESRGAASPSRSG